MWSCVVRREDGTESISPWMKKQQEMVDWVYYSGGGRIIEVYTRQNGVVKRLVPHGLQDLDKVPDANFPSAEMLFPTDNRSAEDAYLDDHKD